MESITITLAGNEYKIRDLTCEQLEELHVGVVSMPSGTPEEVTRGFWNDNLKLLATALKADHPEITFEVLRKMRIGNVQALRKAVDAVLEFSGIVTKTPAPTPGGSPSGEQPAGTE